MSTKLIITTESNPASRQEFVLDQELIAIGRDQANTLCLPDNEKKLVSRKHAQIVRRGGSFYLSDLESRNATFLNGDRIEPERDYPLKDGDVIKIGDFVLAFADVQPPQPIAPVLPPPPPPEPTAKTFYEQLQQAQAEIQQLRQENERLLAATRIQPSAPLHASANRLEAALQVLLETVVKMIQAPDVFISEFEGASVMIPKEYNSAPALKEYLFDPTLADAEATKRLMQINQALERDLVHQSRGFLEGYKNAVQEGARQLLQSLAPITVKQKAAEKKLRLGFLEVAYRYLPLLWQWKAIHLYRQKHEELMSETRGVIEKRTFRPAFLKGYHAFMDSI